jgi:hypothetical protein
MRLAGSNRVCRKFTSGTAATNPAFRAAFKRHRRFVLANSYFEMAKSSEAAPAVVLLAAGKHQRCRACETAPKKLAATLGRRGQATQRPLAGGAKLGRDAGAEGGNCGVDSIGDGFVIWV